MAVRLHVRPAWAPTEGELVYEFDQDRIVIGRGRGADVCLPHRSVSVRHASIQLTQRGYSIVDHDSTNGTRISSARLVPGRPKPLRDRDVIDVGAFSIVFRSGVAVASPTSSERTASLARNLVRAALGVQNDDLRPSLTILNGPDEGKRFVLPEPPARLVIGRAESCDLALNDADVSREHAEIELAIDGVRLRDLGSKNGVFVGGRIVRERLLGEYEEIRIGATVLAYEDPAGARVRALHEGDDSVYESPPTPVEPEPSSDADAEELAPEPEPPSPLPARPSIAPADMVIYVLASVVFAVSVLGLAWLLRG